MNPKKVFLLAESNYLLDIVFERSPDCSYLHRLACAKEITLVIPQQAFAEGKAKLHDIERRRLRQFEASRLELRNISETVLPTGRRQAILAALDEATAAIKGATQQGRLGFTSVQSIAAEIPLTPEILVASHLRRTAHEPPLDVRDVEIYESILAFARGMKEPEIALIFLQRDAAHFDNPEIKAELAKEDVKIYFSAGEAVRRVRELLGK
jgi:hypothetical protein